MRRLKEHHAAIDDSLKRFGDEPDLPYSVLTKQFNQIPSRPTTVRQMASQRRMTGIDAPCTASRKLGRPPQLRVKCIKLGLDG